MDKKRWTQSTERERITKTIKLELVPDENTKKFISEQGALAADKELIAHADALHEVLDYVVRKIITKSLETCNTDFEKLYELRVKSKERNATNKEKSAYLKQKEKALTEITKTISSYKMEGLKNIKNIGDASFLKGGLKEIISKATDIEAMKKIEWLKLLENTSGMTTILQKFVTTRITAMTVWAPKRVLENFEIYADNMPAIQEFISSEDSQSFCEEYPRFSDLQYMSFYEFCITPEGIETYNSYISGVYDENGMVTKGYNATISEINTSHKNDKGYTGAYYKKMKSLNQQILMPRKKQFSVEILKDDDDVRKLLTEMMEKFSKPTIHDMISTIQAFDKNGILLIGRDLHLISFMRYGDHRKIPEAYIDTYIDEQMELLEQEKKAKEKRALQKNIDNAANIINSKNYTFSEIEDFMGDDKIFEAYQEKLSNDYKKIRKGISEIMDSDILTDGNLRGYYKDKIIIKEYIEGLTELKNDIQLLNYVKDDERKNVYNYNKIDGFLEYMQPVVRVHNLIRNYMTSKVGDLVKEDDVCFGSPSKYASRWWNGEKFGSNSESLVRMDGKYYYICVGYKQKPINFQILDDTIDENFVPFVEILNQKTGQDASKQFPRCVFSPECQDFFESNPEENVYIHTEFKKPLEVTRLEYKIYKEKLFSVGALNDGIVTKSEHKKYLSMLIDLYKQFVDIYPHYDRFTFEFLPTEEYADIGLFMADANLCMVDPRWEKVSKEQFDKLVNSGNLYLFLIQNLHMYDEGLYKTSFAKIFLTLMSDENFRTGKMRLNAKPRISYRPACIPKHITHPKGSILVNKKTKDGEYIPTKIYKQIYNFLNGKCKEEDISDTAMEMIKKEKVFFFEAPCDISRNLRYMDDKYFITFSYVKNAKVSERSVNNISYEVAEEMKSGYRTLSVVRGTSHLLYYTVYDTDHKSILEEGDLDKIGQMDYAKKIAQISKERKEAKEDAWIYDVSIKNIKEPYIRHVVSEIVKIALKYEAVIVIENISDSFKDKMSFVDNQLYKSFEGKLEKKLCDCYSKDKENGEIGSIIKPLQIARTGMSGTPIQNGILFRINAAYTSGMCFQTGFVNVFDMNAIKSMKAKKEFLTRFDSIEYDSTKELFVFKFDYGNFKTKKNIEKKKWTVYAGKAHSKRNPATKNYFFVEKPGLTLFNELKNGESIKGSSIDVERLSLREAEALYELFRRTVQVTTVYPCNNISEEYYSSPVLPEDDRSFSPMQVKCRNLAMKLWYHYEREEDKSSKYDYTEDWINYAIEHKSM